MFYTVVVWIHVWPLYNTETQPHTMLQGRLEEELGMELLLGFCYYNNKIFQNHFMWCLMSHFICYWVYHLGLAILDLSIFSASQKKNDGKLIQQRIKKEKNKLTWICNAPWQKSTKLEDEILFACQNVFSITLSLDPDKQLTLKMFTRDKCNTEG